MKFMRAHRPDRQQSTVIRRFLRCSMGFLSGSFFGSTLVDLSRLIVSLILTHSRFRRFSTCVSAVSGVSLVGVSLLSADVAVAVVRPDVISQRVWIPRGRTRAHWKALVKAHTIVKEPRIRQKN
jgi:hypothetical protein